MTAAFNIAPQWEPPPAQTTPSVVRRHLMELGAPTTETSQEAQWLRHASHVVRLEAEPPALAASSDPPLWLNEIYALVDRGAFDDAVDVLFDQVDDRLLAGEFDRCNELLQTIDLARLDTNLIVAVLSITLSAAAHLPYRRQLFERAHKRLKVLAPDRVERLLDGLRG